MTDHASLLTHPAVVTESILDFIVSQLLLFSPSILLNSAVHPSDARIERYLAELVEAGRLMPWNYPGAPAPTSSWCTEKSVRIIDHVQYERAAEAVRESQSAFEARFGARKLRPVETVQIGNYLWACSIAEAFGTRKILAPQVRYPTLIPSLRQFDSSRDVAHRFLNVVTESTGPISGLAVKDVVKLQTKYQKPVSAWLDQRISAWRLDLEPERVEVEVRKLLEQLGDELADTLAASRVGVGSRIVSLTLDAFGLVISPLGLISLGRNLKSWIDSRHESQRVQWFVADTRTRIARRKQV